MDNQIKILIVEDSLTHAAKLQYILENDNYNTTIAVNGFDALEKIKGEVPDIVISDILMPEMDGFELCKNFKELYPDIPFIILTQLSNSDDIIRGIESGADNFIVKLSEPDFILPRVKELIDNFSLRKGKAVQPKTELEIILKNKKYKINSNNNQILDLLISTFESAIEQNKELQKTQMKLRIANEELDRRNSLIVNQSEEKYKALAESLETQVKQRSEELLEANKEIQFQARKLENLFMNAPAPICLLEGPDHIYKFMNPAYHKLVGKRDLINRTIRESLPEIEAQGFIKLLDQVYTSKKPYFGNEIPVNLDTDNDGNLAKIFMNFVYQPVIDSENNSQGISVFAFEITEQVLARQQVEKLNTELSISEIKYKKLAESLEIEVQHRTKELNTEKEQFLSLLMNAPALICLFNGPEHTFVFANPLYHSLYGNRKLIGLPIREALPEIEGQGFFEGLDQVYQSGQPYIGSEMPAMIDRLNNGILDQGYFNLIYHPIFSTDGHVTGITVFAFELTEQVLARQQVEKLNTELSKSEIKYRALSEELEIKVKERTEELIRSNEELQNFAHIASHDLQEPLRMISSYSQLLARKYKGNLDEDANDFIGFILDGSQRMKILIEDVLNHSKISKREGNKELTNLNTIIENVKSNLKLLLEESNTVLTADALPTIKAEPIHMLQLFQNIISNAVKYHKKEIRPVINIISRKSEDHWIISVIDNGIGISPQHFDKIFIIFRRLHGKAEYEGTGIGLANCKKIVEIYGGKIWVESQEGVGSTFNFTLPA